MPTVLSTYRSQVRTILHDQSASFYTDADCNTAINEARYNVVADTGCIRTLQTIYLTQNIEQYPFGTVTGSSVTAGGSGYSSAPTVTFTGGGGTGATGVALIASGAVISITLTNTGAGYLTAPAISFSGGGGSGATAVCGVISMNTIDVLGISAIWGFTRYALDWKPWSEFSAQARFWTNWQQMPAIWSIYGESTPFIGPLPDQNYQCEVDSVVPPVDLVDDTTPEPITRAYQGPVKYYAAYLLKLKEQSFGESAIFKELYDQRVASVIGQTFTRRIRTFYEDNLDQGGGFDN